MIARQKNSESLQRIIAGITGDLFYRDLALWLIVPGSHSEELLGDLNEEYLLRYSSDSELNARSWYQHQAAMTIKGCIWERIERLAAIGTLVDWVRHWFSR